MSNQTVARTSAVLGLALVVIGCGSVSPVESGPGTASAPLAPVSSVSAPTSSIAAPSPAASAGVAPPSPVVVAAASPEPALKELWRAAGPKPPKDGGCCVTVAPDGKIWVSAMFDSMFWIFDREGKYLESWGTPGTGDGQFDFVVGSDGWGSVAFDPDGTIYVADTANHRVQKFDKDRHFVKAWGSFGTGDGQFASASGISSDGRGHVYVVDTDRLDVQQFTSDGIYVRTPASGATVYLIATDALGRLYVDAGSVILVFDANGNQLPGFDLSNLDGAAAGMAIDAAGHLYVATISSYNLPRTKGIYELDASGEVLHAWPGDAESIALDPQGGALYSSFYTEPFIRKLELPKP